MTDDKDELTIHALLSRYFSEEALKPGYAFSESGVYSQPDVSTLDQLGEYIGNLPLDDDPEVFGLHSNADITFQKTTVRNFINTLILINPKSAASGSGKSTDDIVNDLAREIELKIPDLLDVKSAHELSFALVEDGSMVSLGVFLAQEVE